jgi:hypothetical protein
MCLNSNACLFRCCHPERSKARFLRLAESKDLRLFLQYESGSVEAIAVESKLFKISGVSGWEAFQEQPQILPLSLAALPFAQPT